MSYFNCPDPDHGKMDCPEQIHLEIIPRTADLGGFEVRRVLPSQEKRTVGPFVFWDQAGPGEFLTGHGLDVRPHPHIGLSTMTYLFDGSLEHRDSLGNHQIIFPGAVNLMTAGKGIAHSERTPQKEREHPSRLFGIQVWLALPLDKEEMSPDFMHYDKSEIPCFEDSNLKMRVITGEYEGVKSPVMTKSEALFVEIYLNMNNEILIPNNAQERAIHILKGEIEAGGRHYGDARMLVLSQKNPVKIKALKESHFIILGGPTLDAPRYLWWNFVSSSKEKIEEAKKAWKNGLFAKIPGDDQEFIPLP